MKEKYTYSPDQIPPGVSAHVGGGVYKMRCAESGCGELYEHRYLIDLQNHLWEQHGKSVPLFTRDPA